jgi:hypothetical protein
MFLTFTMTFSDLFRTTLLRLSFQVFLNLASSFLTTAHKDSPPPFSSWLLFRFHMLKV